MAAQPTEDPFFGAGMHGFETHDVGFTSLYGTQAQSITKPTIDQEAEAGDDEVPDLVGDQLLDASWFHGISMEVPDVTRSDLARQFRKLNGDNDRPISHFGSPKSMAARRPTMSNFPPARFLDLPENAMLPFEQVDLFNSGACGTIYRAQLPESVSGLKLLGVLLLSWQARAEPDLVVGNYKDLDASKSTSNKESGSLSASDPLLNICWPFPEIHDAENPFRLPRHVAIKRLHGDNRKAFEREVQALQLLSSKPHPHIVPFLGSYRFDKKYHLMFPWADGDLGMFWRLNPIPQRDQATTLWLVKQIKGLADGVSWINDSNTRSDDSGHDHDLRWHGRHGDIKPSNILWFNDTNTSHILKLADFGSSSFHVPGTSAQDTTEKDGIRYTPAYRAPEFAVAEDGIGPKCDIWSLGCVILEFVTWHILGHRGVEQFAACRADKPDQEIPTGDAFFELFEDHGRTAARLKPSIGRWIAFLRKFHDSSRFTDPVLRLVLEKMLVVESLRRSSALEVLRDLTAICHELQNDDSYIASSEERGLDFGDEELRDDSGDLVASDEDDPQVHSSTRSGHSNNRKRKDTTNASSSEQTAAPSTKRQHHRKLGCPYLKAGHSQSELSRACMEPGWNSLHHFKEHLLRCHTPKAFKNPIVCGRCLEGFKSQDLLFQHSREEPQCLIKSPEILTGQVSIEQAINLRSLKRKRSDMTEEDMWFEIFQVLFPGKDLPASPYHEDLTVSSLNTISTQSSTGISEYKDHLRRPMSETEQLALGEKLGNRIGISNPELCKMLAGAFREQQLNDIQEFDRQKYESVYGISGPSDDTPKAKVEVAAPSAQIGSVSFGDGQEYGDFQWLMSTLDAGE